MKDIAQISKGAGISKDQLSETGKPCVLYGELYTKYKSEVITEILSKTKIEGSHLVYSQKNDVIIPSSGETAVDISTARCVPFDNILLGGDLTIIRLKEQDGRFFSYQLDGVRKMDIARIAQGVSVVHLYGDNLKRLKVTFPTIAEQNKISAFLSIVDKRIETQSRAIEDLKRLRLAFQDKLIEQLVCSNNLKSFSEVYEVAGEGGTPDTSKREYYEGGTIPFIKIDDLANKYLKEHKDSITELGMQKSSAWLVPANSLMFSNGATIGAASINSYPVTTKQGVLGIVPKNNISVEYLYYLMTSTYFKKQVHRIITHGTMATAYLKDINKISVPIPSFDKQEYVSLVLSSLSEKENIETQMLSHLQNQKQYLIQRMFI